MSGVAQPAPRPRGSRLRIWGLALAAVLGLLLGGFTAWAELPPAPTAEAMAALQTDQSVDVGQGRWLTFTPLSQPALLGVILYPGGRVDPRAYAPEARALAEAGYMVVIPRMPLNMAVFAPDRAAQIIANYPGIHNWVIGGHSLGGSMAARFAYRHPDAVRGLMLWASYPATSDNLARREDLAVLSVFASRDGLATPAKVEASRPLLPADTQWVEIDGGDHAQFGWYGPQAGDNPATISPTDQQQQIVGAALDFLGKLK